MQQPSTGTTSSVRAGGMPENKHGHSGTEPMNSHSQPKNKNAYPSDNKIVPLTAGSATSNEAMIAQMNNMKKAFDGMSGAKPKTSKKCCSFGSDAQKLGHDPNKLNHTDK